MGEKIAYIDFRAKQHLEAPLPEHLKPKSKGRLALRGSRKRKLELAPELPLPTVKEAVDIAFEAYIARCALGTERQTHSQEETISLSVEANQLRACLSEEDQAEVQRQMNELTTSSIRTINQ